MEGLSEPLAPRTGRLLRRATVLHVTGEKRRVHPAVLHVGVPGGPATCLVLPATEPSDPGLRTDLVAALRVGARPPDGTEPLVWLTRLGGLELQDADALWLAAARGAYAEAEAELVFVVVTRRGWRDPRSGVGRTWGRLRPR